MSLRLGKQALGAASPGTRLTDFLARSGFPLNTRCHGRGVCGGCEVSIEGSASATKACQVRLQGTEEWVLTIPLRSLLRHAPTAVSDFETFIPTGSAPVFAGRLGLALDLGTTTVALLLADLSSGKILARATALNAQAAFGDNVLSRIQACQDDPSNTARLQASFWEDTFQHLLNEILAQADTKNSEIGGLVVAGNTTMLHLACGVDPTPLGRVPFRPAFLEARQLSGETFGLPSAWTILLLPGLSAFVGADITAGVLCCGLAYPEQPALLVDVGTNGEIFLTSPNGAVASATAAGPAFEGCGLLCGMRAAPGAIGHVTLDPETLTASLEIIGGEKQPAHGIAGSAYIDFLAEGRRVGLLTETGRFSPEALEKFPERFEAEENGRSFLLESAREVGEGALRIGEVDIALLLQAKAAIAAGITTLLARQNLAPSDLSRVYLAGGFGRHISVSHAIACGLLPGFSEGQILPVGNTALGGAYLALLDGYLLKEMSALQADTLELNQDPLFEDRFLENLLLP
jgi:uncharacterized 2Fe-2S/4Fe-4S cluster protein (DUF4445 family)